MEKSYYLLFNLIQELERLEPRLDILLTMDVKESRQYDYGKRAALRMLQNICEKYLESKKFWSDVEQEVIDAMDDNPVEYSPITTDIAKMICDNVAKPQKERLEEPVNH